MEDYTSYYFDSIFCIGIEPVFMPVYTRRKKVNPNDKNSKVDFVDEVGDSWEEFNVFHHKFLVWMEVNGYDVTKKYTESEISESLGFDVKDLYKDPAKLEEFIKDNYNKAN